MIRTAPYLAMLGVVAICAPANAEEQGVIRARLDLNRVETTLSRYKSLSEGETEKQLDLIERARGYLAGCSNHDDPGWKAQSERAASLEAAVRGKASPPAGGDDPEPDDAGPAPDPAPSPAQPAKRADARTRRAKSLVDQVEQNLPRLKPGDTRFANQLLGLLKQANDHLKQVRDAANQAHPDYNGTIRRLAPLDAKIRAKLGEKPAAAPETPHGKEPSSEPSGPVVEGPLSEADEAPFAQAQASLARVEEALTKHEGTVFSSPDLEQPTGFEQLLANARAYLSRVRTRNPQVVAFEAQLAAAEQRYAAREAESREQLERLHADGDYDARVQETIADLKKNGNARAPAFPRTWSPAQIRAWVTKSFMPGIETTREQLDFIRRVRLWDPRLRVPGRYHVELKNGSLNAERTALQVLARAKSMTDGLLAEARTALEESKDFEASTVEQLREAAMSPNQAGFGARLIQGAVGDLRKVLAFHEAQGEVPASIQELVAEVRARHDAIRARVEQQVASERLPAPKPGSERLQAIARGFFKEALAVAVSSELKTVEGTWTSKDLISEVPAGGDWVKRTYRVTNEPYKYDGFWVYVVRPIEDRPDHVMVFEYGIRKFAFGAKPVNEWYPYVDQRKFVMLKEHVPK